MREKKKVDQLLIPSIEYDQYVQERTQSKQATFLAFFINNHAIFM